MAADAARYTRGRLGCRHRRACVEEGIGLGVLDHRRAPVLVLRRANQWAGQWRYVLTIELIPVALAPHGARRLQRCAGVQRVRPSVFGASFVQKREVLQRWQRPISARAGRSQALPVAILGRILRRFDCRHLCRRTTGLVQRGTGPLALPQTHCLAAKKRAP